MSLPRMKKSDHPALAAVVVLALIGAGCDDVGELPEGSNAGGTAQILTAADVQAVIATAASALNDNTMAIAVVDRAGTILGAYRRPGAAPNAPDVAVSLARTTGYFSNDQAPLSSRTVRFISGIHFPPAVRDTPNAPLYGVENINRGCQLDDLGDAIFNFPVDRPRSIAGTLQNLPCRPNDTRGCSVGGPILGPNGEQIYSQGITTGKADVFDSTSRDPEEIEVYESSVNGGGVPLYRGLKLIGGVGVAGVSYDRAEFAALIGAAASGRGITTAIDFPNPLPTPGAIFIDGLRLPFVKADPNVRPAGSSPGSFPQGGTFVFNPRDGRQAPETYLIGPRGSTVAGGLTQAEVIQIVDNARAQADRSRAQVRLPFGRTATFQIAVTDQLGEILAEYRQTDALFDATDVVPSKARNAYYFSTREGYEVLRSFVNAAPYDAYSWVPEPPAGQGWAITSRSIGFGGQPLFPPGIDQQRPATPGPWFNLFLYDTLNPCTEGPGPSRGGNRNFLNQNGITWFAGSAPLYKQGRLVGGLGVSGDGTEQNDLVTAAGAAGFEPPAELRVDNSEIITGSTGERVRIPYLKFPRNPEVF